MINDAYSNCSSLSPSPLSLSSKNHQEKMMQPELLLPTWQNLTFTNSVLDHKATYDEEIDLCLIDDGDFSCSFTSPEDSSMVSSNTMILDELFDLRDSCNEIQTCSQMDGLETFTRGDIDDICEWINGDDIEANSPSHQGWSPSLSSESNHNSSVLEVDDHLTLIHLLRAYGEAMENGQRELAEVITNSINDKSSPLANTTARVAYNLFQSGESQGDHIREESSKNLASAFTVLYQSLPNGRFAHFAANSAILDSIPDDAGVIQIVEFDVGEGIQWPSLIEALSRKGKTVRLTSIRSQEECNSSYWNFDDTKKRLLSHAKQYGLKLQIEEKSIEDVGSELMRMKNRGLDREWLVFNCMVGLPHMGRRRRRTSVDDFLREAKTLQATFGGIVVLGDGEAREVLSSCCGYASYFDSFLRYYQALFESLEMNFPVYLAEARAAMESLFLAPLMCPVSWFQDWEEMVRRRDFQTEARLEGRKLSLGSLLEAKEMVVEGENSYNVKIEGMREHEMVLRWKETPLVRVSTWM